MNDLKMKASMKHGAFALLLAALAALSYGPAVADEGSGFCRIRQDADGWRKFLGDFADTQSRGVDLSCK